MDNKTLSDLLKNAFDDSSFNDFCFNYFPEVHSNSSTGQQKNAKIRDLILYCKQRLKMDFLLEKIQAERPEMYMKYTQSPKIEVRIPPFLKNQNHLQRYVTQKQNDTKDANQYPYWVKNTPEEETLFGVFQKEKRIVLLADAGIGKTTELKDVAHQLQENGKEVHWVELKNYTHKNNPLSDFFGVKDHNAKKEVYLVIDGFDESPDTERENIRKDIMNISPNVYVLVSCRNNFFTISPKNENTDLLQGFEIYYLKMLDYQTISIFLDSKLGELRYEFEGKLFERTLLGIPFYLVELVDYFEKNNNQLPSQKTDLYEYIIQKEIKKDTKRYNIVSLETSNKKKHFQKSITKLAFLLTALHKQTILEDDLADYFSGKEEIIFKQSSLIAKNHIDNPTFEFTHKNFQEYLTSKILALADVPSLKKILTFKPEHDKIKPFYANTILFLAEIMQKEDIEKQKKQDFFDFLVNTAPEIILQIPIPNLPTDIKHQTILNIYNEAKQQDAFIHWGLYDYNQLEDLANNQITFSFLVNELDNSVSDNILHNIFNLLQKTDKENTTENELTALKKFIHKLQDERNDIPPNIYQHVLETYINLFDLSKEEVENIIKFIKNQKKDKHTHYETFIYDIISKNNLQDDLDFIDELIIFYNNQNTHYIGASISKCIAKIQKAESILKLLDAFFVEKDDFSNAESVDEETIINIFTKIKKDFLNNEIIYEKLKEIASKLENMRFGEVQTFIDEFFEYLKQKDFLFAFFLYANEKDFLHFGYPGRYLECLSQYADERFLEKLAQETNQGNIKSDIIYAFQRLLYNQSEKKELFQYFYGKLKPEYQEKSKDIDNASEMQLNEQKKRETQEREKKLLVDMDKMLLEVHNFFDEKNEMSYQEMEDIQYNESGAKQYKFCEVVYDIFLMFWREKGEDQKVAKKSMLGYIKTWDNLFFPHILYQYLRGHKPEDIRFEPTQIEYIKKWCDEHITNINFLNYQISTNGNTTNFSIPNINIWIAYFIVRFEFYHYPDEVYLDMLSCYAYDNTDYYEFVVKHHTLEKNKIRERIIQNLNKEGMHQFIIEKHIEMFETENTKLKDKKKDVNVLCKYFTHEREWTRKKAQKTYLRLGGNIYAPEVLAVIQAQENTNECVDFFDAYLLQDTKKLNEMVSARFEQTTSSSEKIKLAEYMIKMNDPKGFEYFFEYVKEYNTLVWDVFDNPFKDFHNEKILPTLFDFFVFCANSPFIGNEYSREDYKHFFRQILINMASHAQIFEEIKEFVTQYMKKNGVSKEIKWYIYFYLKQAEKEYYFNKKSDMQTQEIILFLDKIPFPKSKKKYKKEYQTNMIPNKDLQVNQKYDVFISYSTKDQDAKNELKKIFEDNDIKYWIDEQKIELGENLYEQIKNGMQNARFTVFLVSRNSLMSEWVTTETIFRIMQEHLTDATTLIPVLLDKFAFEDESAFEVHDFLEAQKTKEEKNREEAKKRNMNTSLFDTKIDRLQRVLPQITDIFQKIRESLSANFYDVSKKNQDIQKLIKKIKGI